jgi:hypothetical protein
MYHFTGSDSGVSADITLTTPSFITADTIFDEGTWPSCVASPTSLYTCGHGGFDPYYVHYGQTYDAIGLAILGLNNSLWFFFDPGTFSQLGTFAISGNPYQTGTIVISEVKQTVPEPSGLQLLGVGFVGLIGFGWRQCRLLWAGSDPRERGKEIPIFQKGTFVPLIAHGR